MKVSTVVVLGVLALGGCKKWGDKMEAGRQAMIDGATACPAPATCTSSMVVSQRKVSTCSAPLPADKSYAVGDVVVVSEVANIPTLGRVKVVKPNKAYDIEWAEGLTNERASSVIVAQVCR